MRPEPSKDLQICLKTRSKAKTGSSVHLNSTGDLPAQISAAKTGKEKAKDEVPIRKTFLIRRFIEPSKMDSHSNFFESQN